MTNATRERLHSIDFKLTIKHARLDNNQLGRFGASEQTLYVEQGLDDIAVTQMARALAHDLIQCALEGNGPAQTSDLPDLTFDDALEPYD
jgi:hypothetical protein